MPVNIPVAGGVPGISGPPDWLSAAANVRLDDVRWRGATQRSFGGGASQSAVFKAIHGNVGGPHIFLSFRAAFVQSLSDAWDTVYLGLQKSGGTKAMVVQIQVHGPAFTPAGPPSANPPANIASVQISTRTGAGAWVVEDMAPTWINANARVWLQSAGDVAADPNNRWAVQLRIPVTAAMDIVDNSGPNLGTDFVMWYALRGALSTGAAVVLADYRTAGTTSVGDLLLGNYPLPTSWDQFLLTSGPGAFGGVALGWGDVLVKSAAGTYSTQIVNHQSNTFVARPRNYRPAGSTIPAGQINATFRIANWGSVAGDPNQVNFSSSDWSYVPGNSELVPVNSDLAIAPLAAGANPPAGVDPIKLTATMDLPAGKSRHQCMLVTLSGTNLNFLNDSIYQNMNYDSASLIEREAEISSRGLTPFSARPRDVYLAVEKVNMARDTPGLNEGRFLESTVDRLIGQGGPLAEKLRNARANLGRGDNPDGEPDFGSRARLETILGSLRGALADLNYRDPEGGRRALEGLIGALDRWLGAVKPNEGAALRLASLFDALADWLEASGLDAVGRLAAFATQLSAWLDALPNDQASSELAPIVMRQLRAWLATLAEGERLVGAYDTLARWFAGGRPADQLPTVLGALRDLLTELSSGDGRLPRITAGFGRAAATWLRGGERLDTFVDVLNDAGLTDDELDQLFPTLRIHPYHDTGERVTGADGQQHPVLRAQSSFGLYAYHEGALDGWQTSIEGAQRIADNLYLLAVPNERTARITARVQAVEPGDPRIPEDPIVPVEPGTGPTPEGCLGMILRLLGLRRG
jgi:hypothetical protein